MNHPLWLSRTAPLLGDAFLERLSRTSIAVCGLGGVGGYALEVLARSGVGRLVLIDMDVFEESNLNRQLLSTRSALGRAKTEVARERILSIHPGADVELIHARYGEDGGPQVKELLVHGVVDAIDTIYPKVQLIRDCQEASIPLVSAMGAGGRSDPTRVRTGTLDQVTHDRLAARMRHELRHRGGDAAVTTLPAVWSTEIPPLPVKAPPGTKRFIPSGAAVPAAVGLAAAALLLELLRKGA